MRAIWMQEAVNGTAKEDCDCTHGAYGGFSDVPSHEVRDFTLKVSGQKVLQSSDYLLIILVFAEGRLIYPSSVLQDFPTFDGSRRGNVIRVSNRLVYNHPSHIQVICWPGKSKLHNLASMYGAKHCVSMECITGKGSSGKQLDVSRETLVRETLVRKPEKCI